MLARPARARADGGARAAAGRRAGPAEERNMGIGQESEPSTAGARGEAELARQTVHMGLM